MKKRILISTTSGDIHAIAVQHHLRSKGHTVVRWIGSDIPVRQQASTWIKEDGDCFNVYGDEYDLYKPSFDIVWNRRVARPDVPPEMHPGDYTVARRENIAFYQAVLDQLGRHAVWINDQDCARKANIKPYQLVVAKDVGFKVPTTLVSNRPADIRSFINGHHGNYIYKPFYPAVWRKPRGYAALFTAHVTNNLLPSDDTIKLTPGIYQEEIRKKYEIRLTYMGGFISAAKLDSQKCSRTKIDWRSGPADELEITPISIPVHITALVNKLMARLGLAFGCIDIILTENNDYVFLEINEAGQFLWLEEINQEVPLLDTFCAFLTCSNTSHFSGSSSQDSYAFKRLMDDGSIEQTLVEDERLHSSTDSGLEVQD